MSEPQILHMNVIETTLSKPSTIVDIYSECYHLLNRSPAVTCRPYCRADHTDQDRGDTSVHILLWPNHKQERKCLMMYFMLLLNRKEKKNGEEKLTAVQICARFSIWPVMQLFHRFQQQPPMFVGRASVLQSRGDAAEHRL